MAAEVSLPVAEEILDSLNDGLYVTDTERRILYWNKSDQRITGWAAEDVLGRSCKDNILCHVDKDGRELCTTDLCPLHRCMVTDTMSSSPLVVDCRCLLGRGDCLGTHRGGRSRHIPARATKP